MRARACGQPDRGPPAAAPSAGADSNDLVRQNAVHGEGVVLLRFPVRRLREDGGACGAQLGRLVA